MKKVKKVENIDPSKEFLTALDAIVQEKGIDKGQVLEAMELALASAYKKHTGKTNGKATVNPVTGEIKVYSYITVVEEVTNPETEISLEDAKKINKDLIICGKDFWMTRFDYGVREAFEFHKMPIKPLQQARAIRLLERVDGYSGTYDSYGYQPR